MRITCDLIACARLSFPTNDPHVEICFIRLILNDWLLLLAFMTQKAETVLSAVSYIYIYILTPSLFQFDRMQDLPENHFRVSGASWVNIMNYYLLLLLLLYIYIYVNVYIYIYILSSSESGRNFSVFPAKLGGNNSKLVPKVHFSLSQHQKHGHFEFLRSRWQTLLFLLRRAEGPCFHVEKNIKNVIHRPWWVCVGKSCSSRLELDPRPAASRRTKDVRHMFVIFTVGTSRRVWMG